MAQGAELRVLKAMTETAGRNVTNRRAAALAMSLVAVMLTACSRSPYKLTECVGGEPVVERIHDVAPPNC